ncbi:MAG: SDR family oxidoreductase, partial [Salinibacterium sp.]|nr:SDR family oxidoreductase [Salinibacterium sp.]
GLLGLTPYAALEYGAQKVRTNAVAPGFIHTPLVDSALDAATSSTAGTLRSSTSSWQRRCLSGTLV